LKRGIFVLSYPVIDDGGTLYLGDACYQQTIEICRPFFDEVIIVARRRKQRTPTRIQLEEIGGKLGFELPDFGVDGRNNFLNAIRLLFKAKIRESLGHLMQGANFIYVEGPSLEAYLAAVVASKVGRPIILEMRGEAILNRHYMKQRFGPKGIVYVWFFNQVFKVIRKRAIAGLYINRRLLERYPVAGWHRHAISDVNLPDDIFGEPKHFVAPAGRFLYVGHLEKIKRVDILLQAFQRVKGELPSNWLFDIVGDGPEMLNLNQLAEGLGIKSHVYFHGRIAWGESLFRFYKEANLLLIASTSETGPRTLIEAMAFGLPAISTEIGVAPELLDPQVLVRVGDAVRYAQQLISVAKDPVLMTYLSKQNWQRSQDFRLSKLRAQREAFYAKAIELSSRYSLS